jgi:L-ribulokinase
MMSKYAIGVDFGTESGRSVLIDVETGREVASSVHPYASGVITEQLPEGGPKLEPEWVLQDPQDYLDTLRETIPAVLKAGAASPDDVIGMGIDFTSCTMLTTTKDGTPLCFLPQWRKNPHTWVKIWKHHAAQPEADKINLMAETKQQKWLKYYGDKTSSEWFFSKAFQILDEAPEVYQAAERLIEAGDWIVWQLCGQEKRSEGIAGYKALWSKRDGFPDASFFRLLDPRMAEIVDKKMTRKLLPLGGRAGGLTANAAALTGLKEGTPVAVANIDAHVTVPAAGVTEPGRMVLIMGTSICQMVLCKDQKIVEGICGVVEDGIVPGYFGYEAGQCSGGDIFAWFMNNSVPQSYYVKAQKHGQNIYQYLEEEASKLSPGECGLLALDWWSGNRSVLVDADLSGLLVGLTMTTKPEEIYRALLEATAFGTREIIEAFEAVGVTVIDMAAGGGLPEKNKLLMQIFADVTGREIKLVASNHASALGAAMHGAVAAGKAAGGYDNIAEAAQNMAHLEAESYLPNLRNKAAYDTLYNEYRRLYDYFGRGDNQMMKTLRRLKTKVMCCASSSKTASGN